MSHSYDFIEPVRRAVAPRIGTIVSLAEDMLSEKYYYNSEQRLNQFVGRVDRDVESMERELHDIGYVRNPISWLKRNRSGEVEESSWRKTKDEQQVHAILYDGTSAPHAESGYTYIYAHEEYRWDRYPVKHLMGKSVSPKDGVREVRRDLQDNGIQYDYVQPG